jgi:hypothetical protein
MLSGFYVDFSILIPWILLTAIVVSLGIATWYLSASCLGRKLELRWLDWVKQSWCLSTIFFVVLLWLIPLYVRSLVGNDDSFHDSLVLVCSAATCGVVGWWLYHGRHHFASNRWMGKVIPGLFSLLLVVAIFGAFSFSWRTIQLQSMSRSELLISIADHLRPVNDKVGRTAIGREIPLFAWDEASLDQKALWCNTAIDPEYVAKTILRSEPDLKSNCHGWVFAEGKFLLMPEAVEMILADNSFLEVSLPVPGDVVVYRDNKGVIVHSGIIRAILGNSSLGEAITVLVESKWGLGSCYLHPVDCQPYSQSFAFYRRTDGRHGIEVGEQPLDYQQTQAAVLEIL